MTTHIGKGVYSPELKDKESESVKVEKLKKQLRIAISALHDACIYDNTIADCKCFACEALEKMRAR